MDVPYARLTAENFILSGTQNKTLGINMRGSMLVLFTSTADPQCREALTVFHQLALVDQRVSYGMHDIAREKKVIHWSRSSTTPITTVPSLILYINQRPYVKYNGAKNIPSLQGFISKALKPVGAADNQPFMQPPAPAQGNIYGNGAPAQGRPKNMPDFGGQPSMKGALKGGNPGYATGGNYVEDEEDSVLMTPDAVTPWNRPWEADSQQNY